MTKFIRLAAPATLIALFALLLLLRAPAVHAEKEPDQALPHIRIDPDARLIDVDARVVLREGEWLELIACSPGSREHESLVVALARPSHIHLALLTLGLEPGEPMSTERTEDGFVVHPAHGPAVAVSFVVEEDGQTREVPANEWVVQQQTGEVMENHHFLFTGSAVVSHQGQELYMADLNGTIVSLVNFGEDLLARETDLTNHTDDQAWNANTPRIPPVGTPILLRLRPVEGDGQASQGS